VSPATAELATWLGFARRGDKEQSSVAAIWSGAINFGLVAIPVKLRTAIRDNDLRFNFLHKKDEGRINNIRRCSVCGEEVSYDELVRGYEIEKGRYVLLDDEDFKRAAVEATQSVDIVQFVELSEIDPMFFDKPYYLEPEKKGRHAYALLREALHESKKVGIARVVIRSREHLAAVEANGDALVLNLMHFAEEIVDTKTLELPKREAPPENEMKVAKLLIDSMAGTFEPEKYEDRYRGELMTMIEAKAAGTPLAAGAPPAPMRDNVVNLMDILQKSLEATKRREAAAGSDAESEAKPKKTARRKSSAA
jgi:DNA end-binding protein Ku